MGVVSRPLFIIDRAADIVVFPEKVTRAEADKFFDKSLQDLKNIDYDIDNSSIKSIVRKVYLISNSDVSQGLLLWQEGFWRFKGGYSSYESYYTRGDVYLDRANDALRELQEEYNSLSC